MPSHALRVTQDQAAGCFGGWDGVNPPRCVLSTLPLPQQRQWLSLFCCLSVRPQGSALVNGRGEAPLGVAMLFLMNKSINTNMVAPQTVLLLALSLERYF